MNFLLLALGVILLTAGGEALIRGSLGVAKLLGVSPLFSGLVIVGFGTSAPELVVSLDAALHSRADIAIGNVVGSNIGNILLIVGICAVITPLTAKPLALSRDALVVVAASILFLFLISGSVLGRGDAAVLLSALLVYLILAYWSERFNETQSAKVHIAEAEELLVMPESPFWTTMMVSAGLILLIGGSQVLLVGAVGIAKYFGVSEAVIGLTLVAIGTSLPELSISIIATLRKHTDVAIGNILGSNIFNLLGILGISAFLQPLPVHTRILQFDQWVMVGSSLLLFLFLFTGRRISRTEGGLFLTGYVAYIGLSFTTFGQ